MEVKDLEALIQITKEIETQGYNLLSVDSQVKCIGSPTLEITILFSRKRPVPECGKPQYVEI
jgi:hypothetical protein